MQGGLGVMLSPPPCPPDHLFLPQTSREMVARSAATLITQPFHGR